MKKGIKSQFIARFSSTFCIAILLIGLQSCVKDNFKFDKLADIQWDPNVATPLVYSSMSIADMLDNVEGSEAYLVEESDKSLTVVYRTNLFSIDASSLVSLPNQNNSNSIPVGTAAGLPVPFSSGSFTFNSTFPIQFATGSNGTLIDSMSIKYGSIYLSFSSDLHNNGSIVITIPNVTKNGIPFSQTLPLNYTGSVPVVATSTFDLTGYNFDMTKSGSPYNEFDVNYAITIEGSSTPVAVTDKIDVTLMMNSLEFSKIFGYIGNLPLSVPADTLDLSIFTNSSGAGSFSLDNPNLTVVFSNSYGLPIDAHLTTFQGYTPGVGFYPFTGVPDPLPIPSPNMNQVGQVLTDSFKLDKANSNIAAIVNNTPKEIVIQVDAQTNIAGPTQNNFIMDTSRFSIDMELNLPLYGTATNFTLMDTIPFTFEEDLPEQVESGLIRIANSNGFPIDFDVQVYFVDSTYKRLDSLVTTNILLSSSGIVDPTGRVISPTNTVYDAIVTKQRLELIKNAKNLIIIAVASTSNGGTTNVKIYSDYKLDFKIGLQAQLHVNANQ